MSHVLNLSCLLSRQHGSFVELDTWLSELRWALWNEVRHLEHSQFRGGDVQARAPN